MASSEASYISDLDQNSGAQIDEPSDDEINEISEDGDRTEAGSHASSDHAEPWFAPSDISPLPDNEIMNATRSDLSANPRHEVLLDSIDQDPGSSRLPIDLVQPGYDTRGVSSTRLSQDTLECSEVPKEVHPVYAVRLESPNPDLSMAKTP